MWGNGSKKGKIGKEQFCRKRPFWQLFADSSRERRFNKPRTVPVRVLCPSAQRNMLENAEFLFKDPFLIICKRFLYNQLGQKFVPEKQRFRHKSFDTRRLGIQNESVMFIGFTLLSAKGLYLVALMVRTPKIAETLARLHSYVKLTPLAFQVRQ